MALLRGVGSLCLRGALSRARKALRRSMRDSPSRASAVMAFAAKAVPFSSVV